MGANLDAFAKATELLSREQQFLLPTLINAFDLETRHTEWGVLFAAGLAGVSLPVLSGQPSIDTGWLVWGFGWFGASVMVGMLKLFVLRRYMTWLFERVGRYYREAAPHVVAASVQDDDAAEMQMLADVADAFHLQLTGVQRRLKPLGIAADGLAYGCSLAGLCCVIAAAAASDPM